MSLSWLSCVSSRSSGGDGKTASSGKSAQNQQQPVAAGNPQTVRDPPPPIRTACRCLINSGRQSSQPPPPIPVPIRSQRSRRREVKEDSGCYVTEPKATPTIDSTASNPPRWSLQEDSGVYSSDNSHGASQQPHHPKN